MPTQRQLRLNNLLQHEISDIIRRELKDPDLGFWTVTGVSVSPDIRNARVFVSVLGDEKAKRATLTVLSKAKTIVRALLRDRLDTRVIPVLSFRLDETAEKAQHMEVLLHKVAEEFPEDEDEVGLEEAPEDELTGETEADPEGTDDDDDA